MPNRSELKARVLPAPEATPDHVDLCCLVALCLIGALASIDFAAYLQSIGQWPVLCAQACAVLVTP